MPLSRIATVVPVPLTRFLPGSFRCQTAGAPISGTLTSVFVSTRVSGRTAVTPGSADSRPTSDAGTVIATASMSSPSLRVAEGCSPALFAEPRNVVWRASSARRTAPTPSAASADSSEPPGAAVTAGLPDSSTITRCEGSGVDASAEPGVAANVPARTAAARAA
ncbi:hypothetical protein GCM10009647_003830 [Streptomyces sanglieri]